MPSCSPQQQPSAPSSNTSAPSIVGIGASAGGLAALRAFFTHVPKDSGLAYVVVVHLSPDHESYMPDLLQPHTPIPMQQVTGPVPLEPNHAYIIPPGSYLSAIDTHLRLSELEEKRYERGPIDHFFRTLAQTYGGRSVGVILTGTGSDGTIGIKAIKEQGGLTIVQDPEEAEYDGMPRSALATGLVDLVLPVAEIPEQIIRILRTQPHLTGREDGEQIDADERQDLQKLFAQVRARTHRDFSRYKRSTILRRIQRRMQLREVETLPAYLQVLREQPDEVSTLADEFLITVTSFFRDPEVFAALEQQVIPQLFEDQAPGDQLRVWSVGCATGEEAYSLAMLLEEAAELHGQRQQFQVFASDLHERSLKHAREGLYSGNIEADVSPERMRRFFTKENGSYRIRDEIRERVVFAQHNLLGDPPFSKLDLIVCRNVLIYLERSVQRDVIELFHFALKPNRYLLLGQSEQIEELALFQLEDKAHGIHRKRIAPSREPRLPVFLASGARFGEFAEPAALPFGGSFGALHEQIVERYAPPSILIDAQRKVVHVSEHAGRFLQVPGGEPNASVFRMIRAELRLELHAALHEAEQKHEAVRSNPVDVQVDGATSRVVLFVQTGARGGSDQDFALVIFEEWEERKPQPDGSALATADARTLALQSDLELARQRLQVVIDEHATSQEEMRTANEELQSANEELRSTMEELETSREELQAINEELAALNQENRHKVDELNQLTNDLQNLIVATDIPTLFLDRQLRIVRSTPRVGELFNLRETDRGRLVSDLTHRLDYNELTRDAQQVLDRLTPIEREVQDDKNCWYLIRLLPYRSADDRIGGVVITFVDITGQKRAAQEVFEAKKYAEDIVNTIDEPLMILTPDLRIRSVNRPFCTHFEVELEQTVGRLVYSIGNGQWDIPELRRLLEDVLPEDNVFNDYEVTHHFENLGDRVMLVNGRRLDHVQLILLGFRDITELKKIERALRDADRRKDEFLATLSHELRNPLAPIRTGLEIMKRVKDDPTLIEDTRGMMERQTMQLITLVDDLMDISRITQGKFELRQCRVILSDVVQSAVEASRPQIEEACHQLTVSLPEEPIPLLADPHRLAQVLSNLLNNSAKYTPEGGRIWLTAERENGVIRISVKDTGVGISNEMLGSVFEMFRQVNYRFDQESSGLGIGLALVKSLVEMHGGRIEANSAGANQGSEFLVRLPIMTGDGSVAPQTPPAPGVTPPRSRHKVLVVDDNKAAANTLSMMVKLLGHEALTAYDGQQALDVGPRFSPDLVLMDLGMPKVNGYEAARRLRQQPWGEKVLLVAVSGWGQEENMQRTKDAGFDCHLVKPVEPSKLQVLLSEIEAHPAA